MQKTETLEDFYQHKMNYLPQNLKQDIGHFNVFRMEDCNGPGSTPVKYSRRDFYKVSLMRGDFIFHYADRSIPVSGTTLVFFKPGKAPMKITRATSAFSKKVSLAKKCGAASASFPCLRPEVSQPIPSPKSRTKR
jgi:hypothetical protein